MGNGRHTDECSPIEGLAAAASVLTFIGVVLFIPALVWWIQSFHEVAVRKSGTWFGPAVSSLVFLALGFLHSKRNPARLVLSRRNSALAVCLGLAGTVLLIIPRLHESYFASACLSSRGRDVWSCAGALSLGRRYRISHERDLIIVALSDRCRSSRENDYSCWVVFNECRSSECLVGVCAKILEQCRVASMNSCSRAVEVCAPLCRH